MKALQTKGARLSADTEIVIIRYVVFGILPFVKSSSLRLDEKFGNKCFFRHVEAEEKPSKKSKKGGAKGFSCLIKGVFTIGLCVSRFLSEKFYSTWTRKNGIKTHRQILQGHVAPNKNSGTKGSIARHYPKVWTSWAQSLRAKIRGKITWGNLAPRKMRPRSSIGFGENIYKLKNADKTSLHASIEAKAMPAPTSKSPEEREFVVDSRSINAHAEQKRF